MTTGSASLGPGHHLRYSQCWEDVGIARAALQIRPGSTVLAIGAAGDNVLALLQDDPAVVLAVDVNPAQTALLHLKMAASRCVDDAGQLRSFLGAAPGLGRTQRYEAFRAELPPPSQAYWDSNLRMIEGGVLNGGRFERYVARFRRAVLPLAPGRRAIREMLNATSLSEQRRIYGDRWDSHRWRLLFKLFFSRRLLERFGRDRAFFAHCEIDDIGAHYLARARHALTNVPIWNNPYLTWMMSGEFGTGERLPDYLRADVQAAIRPRIARIEAQTATLDEALEDLPPDSVDAFYLSDVFELSDPSAYAATLAEIARVGRPGARICYWNNLVSRRRPEALAGELLGHPELSSKLHAQDRAFLYSAFVVESVQGAKA